MSTERKELVGASRFFSNEAIEESELIEASVARAAEACAGRRVLLIEDTTELNYQHHRGQLDPRDAQLGPVGKAGGGIGFFLHPVLALDRDSEQVLGIAAVRVWNRPWDQPDTRTRDYRHQRRQDKESWRWIACAEQATEALGQATGLTLIADRESDIYELFTHLPKARMEVLVRVQVDRCLEEGGRLFEAIEAQPPQGHYGFELGQGTKKRQHRQVHMEVRYRPVTLRRPRTLSASEAPAQVALWAIDARESAQTAVAGEAPLHWRLLTSRPIESLAQAREAIGDYARRWTIEQLFRSLKAKGLELEDSQLRSGAALRRLALMSLNVALVIMQLVGARDQSPGLSARGLFNATEMLCLGRLCTRYEGATEAQKNPYPPESLAWAAWVIGRLGGWKGYRRAGPPGPISFHRGLAELYSIVQGFELFQQLNSPPDALHKSVQ